MKKINQDEFLKRLKDPVKEFCIICGSETPYKKTDEISSRKYYIEGSGQLCEYCYFLIYYGEKKEERVREKS